MAEDDLSVITDPKRRKLLEDIRGIGAQFKAPPKGSAPNRFDPLMPPLGVHNKAQVLGADAAAIGANGLPGYTDPTARMKAGMNPGAYQFNMPGPQTPPPGPPPIGIPGSLRANMAQKFRALMDAPGTPEEEAVKAAVASRQPNPGLTMKDFMAQEVEDPAGNGNLQRRELEKEAQGDYSKSLAGGDAQAAKDANARVFAANPTAAAANTYLRNRAQRAGVTPEALLSNNAKRAEARKAAASAPTGAGAPNKFGPLMNAPGFDMNLARQDITNGFRQGGPAGGQLALDLHLGKMRQDMAAHELAMQQRNSDVHNRVAEGELALKNEAAKPEAIGARARAEQDPDAVARDAAFASGKLDPSVIAALEAAHGDTNYSMLPDSFFYRDPAYRSWLFGQMVSKFPKLTQSVFDQWANTKFGPAFQKFDPGAGMQIPPIAAAGL